MLRPRQPRSPFASLWTLDPEVVFLNHGSFGACPRAVLDAQSELRARIEREPVRFFVHELEPLLDAAREELAAFLGAEPSALAFVPNATTGVSTVLGSLRLQPGDELLTTSHRYNACRNALDALAARTGARVVEAEIPLPVRSPRELTEAVLGAVTPRTRLALLDHVSSPTALVLPLEEIVPALHERGVETLVDGAHAPGMLPLRLGRLGATYYTGNCHKWICAPKGAGFLLVQPGRTHSLRPLVISHGANLKRAGRSRFHLEFDWLGTLDPSAYLSVPAALRTMGSLLPGGWPELMQRNHALAVEARGLLEAALGAEPVCPEPMLGSMAAVPLPDGAAGPAASALYADPLHEALFDRYRIEVPVVPWPAPPRRLLRVSAQIYNTRADYEALVRALDELLDRGNRSWA
jgi:isopenicillin-N epimerase